MTGHQLLVKIRKSENNHVRNLPVIVMTTFEDNTDRNLAFPERRERFHHQTNRRDGAAGARERALPAGAHHSRARSQQHALAELATTDPLTRLRNRRAFFENGAKALAMARRYVSDLSVILLDIDHFKKINDNYGHQAGDEALIAVAHIMTELTRDVDTVARIGGEEFAILLPDTNRLGTAVLAERIAPRSSVNSSLSATKIVPITVSIGIASFGVDPGKISISCWEWRTNAFIWPRTTDATHLRQRRRQDNLRLIRLPISYF